jgi:ABC-type sugar transport system ATPase subunit
MTELFRARNVFTNPEKSSVLRGLNINIYTGEILGIFGISNSGKNVILGLIERKKRPIQGSVFYKGSPDRQGAQNVLTAVRITREGSLLKNRPVWENLLIIRSHVHRGFLLHPSLLMRYMNKLLAGYGVGFTAEQRTGDLSEAERLQAELIKAMLANAEIILIDNVNLDFKLEELEKTNALMQRLAREDISIVIADSRFDCLKHFAHRIAFLKEGQVLKITDNLPVNYPTMEKTISLMLPAVAFPGTIGRFRKSGSQKPAWLLKLKSSRNDFFNVNLYPGEVTAIINLTGTVLELPGGDKKTRIISMDFDTEQIIVESLSPGDNLCLGIYDRLSILGCIIKKRKYSVTHEFTEWYGKDALAGKRDCRSISELDKLAIILFRLLVYKPAVMIAGVSVVNNDKTIQSMIAKGLAELARNGTAVGFMPDSPNTLEDFADRYVVINENGVRQDVGYDEIKIR